MARKLAFASLLFLFLCRPGAQAAEHQRIGVAESANLILMAGISIEAIGIESDEGTALEIDPSFKFEALYGKRLGLSFEVPITIVLPLDGRTTARMVAAMGDPSMVISYTIRVDGWRLGADLAYSHPLGVWSPHEAEGKRVISGSGYRKISFSLSSVRYMDPIIAGFALSADSYFDRREQYGSGSRPLVLTASLFATEALNNVVALSSGLSQRLAWPRLLNGSPAEAGLSYSLSGKLSLDFTEGGRTISVGISKSFSEVLSPIVFSAGFSLSLSGKGE